MNAVDWALAQDLNAPKKLLLVALAWVSDESGVTFKGQATIGQRMGKDARWVREHLPALAECGLLTRYRRHRENGSRTSDVIVLNLPREEELDLSVYSGLIGEREPGDCPPTGGNPPGGLPVETRRPSGGIPPGHPINKGDPLVNSGEARAREPARKAVSYRGRRITDAVVGVAERLLVEFGAQTHRQIGARTGDGSASPALKQILGAMLTRPDVTEAQWTEAIRKTVSTPPGWVDGRPLQLGDVFGDRAAEWALSPAGRSATVGRTRSSKGRDFSRFDRYIE